MSDLQAQADALTWYHTIELAPGVVTKGQFDCRPAVPKLPIPASLAGKRCLDVGTCDGFWAFELEKRGADEVVGIDLADTSTRDRIITSAPLPPMLERAKRTFSLAHEALGSKVEWRDLSVYDLSPDKVGMFDFVFIGSLLLHLRDPVLALTAVRSVTKGVLLSHDQISPGLSLIAPGTPAARLQTRRNDWWIPNRAARVAEVEAAGFVVEKHARTTWVKVTLPLRWRALRRRPLHTAMLKLRGIPHTSVLAHPAPAGG